MSLEVIESEIPGLFEVNLELFGDSRGWFKENYQKEKLEALGLPKFNIVQNNFSYNEEIGSTRGLHAEPWNKYISLANGRVFCAWVDLRKGSSFGKVHTLELTPEKAVYVPAGVANGYQTIEKNVTYTYLVDAHWSPEVKYVAVNLFDPELNINWPVPPSETTVSEKDMKNPPLKNVEALEF